MKAGNWMLFTSLLLILIAWFCYQPATQFTHAQGTEWTEPRPISERSGAGWAQELAVDAQGRVHVVWIGDSNDGDSDEDAVFYSVWDGIEWSEPVDIFYASRGSPFIPAIAVDPWGEVHVVFDWRHVGGIYYMHAPAEAARSAQAWSAPVTINNKAHSYFSYIEADGQGTIHVVWEDRTAPLEAGEIFYSQLGSKASGWLPPINLSQSLDVWSSHPQIVVYEQNVWITWAEGSYQEGWQPYCTRSVDRGASWQKPIPIDTHGMERGPAPFLDADGHLHMVWFGSDGGQIKHTMWTSISWSEPTVVAAGFPYNTNSWLRAVADNDDNLHVIWRPSREAGDTDIYYSMSSDDGQTWSPATVIGTGQWRTDLIARLGYELIAVWGKERELHYSVLKTNAPAGTPAPLPPTPTPTLWPTATALPLPVATATMTPSPTPLAETFTAINPIDPNRGATYLLIVGVVPAVVLLGLVVLVRSLRRRDVF